MKVFLVDSTRHYVAPAGKPRRPDVCDEDHDPPYNSWCQGRDWDSKVPGTYTPLGTFRIWPIKNSYGAWVEYLKGTDLFVKTCPPDPDVTADSILVPIKGTGCFTRKYRF